MLLSIRNRFGNSRKNINKDDHQAKKTVGNTQTEKDARKTPVIEKQTSSTNSVASNSTYITLSHDFNDEMEEIKGAVPQYEEEPNIKQAINEAPLISPKPPHSHRWFVWGWFLRDIDTDWWKIATLDKKKFFFSNAITIHQMLHPLEQIDKNVAAGDRTKSDATHATYLEELYLWETSWFKLETFLWSYSVAKPMGFNERNRSPRLRRIAFVKCN